MCCRPAACVNPVNAGGAGICDANHGGAAACLSPWRVPICIPHTWNPSVPFLPQFSHLFFLRSLIPRHGSVESHCIVPVPVRLVLIFSSLLEAGIVLDLRSNLAKSSFSVFVPMSPCSILRQEATLRAGTLRVY